jgi:hypothetical protein
VSQSQLEDECSGKDLVGRQVRVHISGCMRLRRFISGISDPTNATNYRYLVDKYQPLRFPIVSSKREP